MKVENLKYPKKSHRKQIKTPQDSVALAELMGIEFGDGEISNSWQMVVTLNAEKDKEYAQHVVKLISELFGIDVAVKKRGERTLKIIASSTSLVDFLISKGAVRGNKVKQGFDIPDWIQNNKEYEKAFARGIVDTDGCLYIHNHVIGSKIYKNIGFCFTSSSKNLLDSTANIFLKFGIRPHVTDRGRRIYLYSEKAIIKYLNIIGTDNPRIYKIYEKWKGARAV